MRLVGIRTGRRVDVAVQLGDRVTPIAEVTEFYAELDHWLAQARRAERGQLAPADVDPRTNGVPVRGQGAAAG